MANKGGGLIAGLLATAIFLAIFEVGARLVFRFAHLQRSAPPVVTYPYHPYLGWENLPNHRYTGELARGLTHWANRTDGHGESVTPLEHDPHPDVSVVVVGGSAMFGVGQSDNQYTVASQLERQLHQRTGARVEVHNLAVGGYTSFQEALNVERFLANHHADVIVSVSGYNDAFAAAIEGGPDFGLLLHRLDPKTEMVRSMERGGLRVVPVAAVNLLGALRRRSAAVDLLGKVSDRMKPPPPAVPWTTAMPESAKVVRRARFVITNYAMMDGMARQNGAKFFMFLQPTALNRRQLTASERAAIDSLNRDFMERARPVMKIFYPTVVAAPKAFEFHDLSACLDDYPGAAFADECHYVDGATPTIAAAIADVITPAVAEAAKRAVASTAVGAAATPPSAHRAGR